MLCNMYLLYYLLLGIAMFPRLSESCHRPTSLTLPGCVFVDEPFVQLVTLDEVELTSGLLGNDFAAGVVVAPRIGRVYFLAVIHLTSPTRQNCERRPIRS